MNILGWAGFLYLALATTALAVYVERYDGSRALMWLVVGGAIGFGVAWLAGAGAGP